MTLKSVNQTASRFVDNNNFVEAYLRISEPTRELKLFTEPLPRGQYQGAGWNQREYFSRFSSSWRLLLLVSLNMTSWPHGLWLGRENCPMRANILFYIQTFSFDLSFGFSGLACLFWEQCVPFGRVS